MAIDRRGFLGALALAPAALAGCATASGGAKGRSATSAQAGLAGRGDAPREPGALGPVRSFPLPRDAEPAAVFRAVAARPGEP